jgi:carbamoyltransferase
MISLGISCNHDAGVVILENDQILFAANEERYTRRKFDFGFPLNALREALELCDAKEISLITLDGRMQTPHPKRQNLVFTEKSIISRLAEFEILARTLFGTDQGVAISRCLLRLMTQPSRYRYRRNLRDIGLTAETRYAEHHRAHAASSSMLFGATKGLAVTVDAFGEGICAGTWTLDNGLPIRHSTVPGFHSVGMLYLYVTHLLGFKIGQEGKVTGLAGHGDGRAVKKLLLQKIGYSSQKQQFVNHGLGYGSKAIDRLQPILSGFDRADIAAGVQSALEELVLLYIRDALTTIKTKNPPLYLAGGVFANVSLNRRIAEELPVSSVAVAPNMGDGGLALGAALLNHSERINFRTLYLGTDVTPTIGRVPIELWTQLSEIVCEDLTSTVAEKLAHGEIVAISRGRMEFGPRALGNRSILAPAKVADINNSLNRRLKRTEFMPFAPVVRDVDASRYFHLTQPQWAYENMTVTCAVRELAHQESPAIVHVDGTARPQVLTRMRNSFVYDILTAYSKKTGHGILVNTSFNIHEEPIVRDAETSIQSFIMSKLDALVLGDRLFTRKTSR